MKAVPLYAILDQSDCFLSLIHIYVGFAAGIIATVIVSVLKSLGVEIESRLIWSTGNNEIFGIVLSVLFGGMIVFGAVSYTHLDVYKRQFLMCDLNDLKGVNDRFGHDKGDELSLIHI